MLILDIIVTVMGILGAILLIYKNKNGFLCFIVHSLAWALLSYLQGNYGALITCMVFICIDTFGYCKWTRDQRSYLKSRKLLDELACEGQEIDLAITQQAIINSLEGGYIDAK